MKRVLGIAIWILTAQLNAQYETKALAILQKKCTACHSLPRIEAKKILRVIEEKIMPPPFYLALHPENGVTEEELRIIAEWASKES